MASLTVGQDGSEEALETGHDFVALGHLDLRGRRAILNGTFDWFRLAPPPTNFLDALERAQVIRRSRQHRGQLGKGVIELSEIEKRPPQRGARSEIFGVNREAGPADADRFPRPAGTAKFLGERRKRQRRRILLDPASQIVDARAVRHGDSVVQLSRSLVPRPRAAAALPAL